MATPVKVLFFGARGWIGQQFLKVLTADPHLDVCTPHVWVDDVPAVAELLDSHQPDRVLCFVGRTHGPDMPSIDYLEEPGRLVDNVRDNLFAPVSLALQCQTRGVHLTYLGTGCIFSETDPETRTFEQDDLPNFFGSQYSVVKGFTDRLLHVPPLSASVLNVRIRMPITADLTAPRNLLTKLLRYPRICSVKNSMSVLPTLFPVLKDIILRRHTGTVHLVNPGLISHDEILIQYREVLCPGYTWDPLTVEEQNALLKSQRSNNHLDTTWLETEYPDVPSIADAVRQCWLANAVNNDT